MPFMKDGKRSYDKELRWEKEEKPMRVKQRAQRNAARAMLMEEGRVRKGDDVDHKKPLSKGGSNARSNLRAISASKNRSVKRKQDGSLR
jgi:5-methylcytosine-specific restriction endonuclease McrA